MIYKKAYLYTIKSESANEVYIGSTTQNVSIRFSKHKNNFKRHLQGKGEYCSAFGIIVNDDAEIFINTEFDDIDKVQLKVEELKLINKYKTEDIYDVKNIRVPIKVRA